MVASWRWSLLSWCWGHWADRGCFAWRTRLTRIPHSLFSPGPQMLFLPQPNPTRAAALLHPVFHASPVPKAKTLDTKPTANSDTTTGKPPHAELVTNSPGLFDRDKLEGKYHGVTSGYVSIRTPCSHGMAWHRSAVQRIASRHLSPSSIHSLPPGTHRFLTRLCRSTHPTRHVTIYFTPRDCKTALSGADTAANHCHRIAVWCNRDSIAHRDTTCAHHHWEDL
ncbi:hypothetical protein QBC36DRAFT_66734 [Triangularia setosa]|uniref:Secreted protein n=1 Tax=Triangularia setosa TaxID=2587417 RepID=A0AAN7ACN4_9PEZI|nr:hypothetical protein QBC36DRAFT_66734 [Podospora setosa]